MSSAGPERRVNRTLTAKYDMGSLRALQKLESDFMISLAGFYGCGEDDVPVELDLLEIYNKDEAARPPALDLLLKDVPGDTTELVRNLIGAMIELHASEQKK
mmetsp:Transcript_23059/g.51250  ORF Transcript_23059/g.51250 Transcript_23059/m.51250 type:complete len:102 (+) Transcript_23059:73-378(+)|eukprot:CAMPEP_0173182046 /NCGR_PEP_ID=MMETSP1141-20130122/7618_1 /TAXON_ID=483371 /ORGANISM="non described non described, Strain CCMP2298" /LENGTH=101 /DNA_ID=CAMNT_0014105093 /DNA_START=50 /DNA_END=355 /DNA_ORIENTATION=-